MSRTGENSGSTFWVELPFGVGAKALGGLPGGMQALLRSPSNRRVPPADAAHEREGSALHRIMDQGGLVELLADGAAGGGVITRTLADPSMGTQTLRLEPPGPRRPPLLTRETSEATAVATPVAERSAPPCAEKAPLAVLVVDDDPLTRTLMKRLLTRLGCAVDTAEHGGAGLARALAGAYAVVFLDNQMPVMTGVEAVAALRAAGRDDFVVGVTGNALLSDQEEYLAAGVDQCVLPWWRSAARG
jgi:osomolarity two-component system sensor histidine kinase SLN1